MPGYAVSGIYRIGAGDRSFGGFFRGTEHFPAPSDRHYCRGSRGHCRDYRHRKNWGAITEWFGNLWQAVSQKLMELWNGGMGFFTETIPAAFQTFIGFFDIPGWWSGLWFQVSAFFTNTWNTILQNPIVQLVVTTITSLWENVKNTLQGIWAGI